MIAGFILLALLSSIAFVYAFLSRKHRSHYLALAEYWVYLPGVQMPPQDDIMSLMIRENPYHRRGVSPIGPKEGLIFSDVRLHVALVLRSKNPHIFRPDLFEDHIIPPAVLIEDLKNAKSLVKLRFASDIPLKNKDHLQFLLHASDAVAELGSGNAIYDVKAERLLSRQDLQSELKANFDTTVSTIHVNVIWKPSLTGGKAETRGLIKIGVSELQTGEMDPDQRVIATTVLNEAVRSIWDLGTLPPSLDVTTFDDTFRVQVEKVKDAMASVKILRVQAI